MLILLREKGPIIMVVSASAARPSYFLNNGEFRDASDLDGTHHAYHLFEASDLIN